MKKYFVHFILTFLISSLIFSSLAGAQQAPAPSPKPHLLISGYSTEPEQVSPGEEFTLHLAVKNESITLAKNIFLTLGATTASSTKPSEGKDSTSQDTEGTDSLSVLGTSNARFIPTLKGKRDEKISFRLISGGKVSPGVYNLEIKLEYENPAGTSYTSSQTIGVVIKRKADLRIVNLEYPSATTTGKKFTVTAEVINQSGFSVGDISVEFVSNDFEVSEGYLFIGTLETGDSDSLEAKAVAKEAGEKKGQIIVKYKDDFGQEEIVQKEIKIKVKPAQGKSLTQKSSKEKGFFARIWAFFKALLGLGK